MDSGSHVGGPGEELVEVRGNAALYGLVTVVAGVGSGAYAWRGIHSGGWSTWLVAAALAVVAVVHAAGWWDCRSPRLVADAQGLRLRRGRTWTGTPWSQVEALDVAGRTGLRDERLRLRTEDDRVTYVRVGATAHSSTGDLLPSLQALGAPVGDEPDESPRDADTAKVSAPSSPLTLLRRRAGGAGDATGEVPGHRRAVRADVHSQGPTSVGTLALQTEPGELPEVTELRGTQGRVGLVLEKVALPSADRPEETAADAAPVDPYPTRPASEPVIGPVLRAARERLRLDVDQLGDRTRIRPHIIESVEVDDFGPCGGDFYARGHLRSLSRVLGVDPAPLLRTYDETYASAPIDARRVFEAELATGPQAALRATTGGPNWAALLGVVLVLAIGWGIARALTTDATPSPAPPGPAIGGLPTASAPADPSRFAGLGAAPPVRLRLSAHGGSSAVVVRDSDGRVQWRGTLANGQRHTVEVEGPATITARHGGVVTLAVNGHNRGKLGPAGSSVRRHVRAGSRGRRAGGP